MTLVILVTTFPRMRLTENSRNACQVILLVRSMEIKDMYLDFFWHTLKSAQVSLEIAQGEIKSLHHDNSSLTRHLADYTTASLRAFSQSFKNSL